MKEKTKIMFLMVMLVLLFIVIGFGVSSQSSSPTSSPSPAPSGSPSCAPFPEDSPDCGEGNVPCDKNGNGEPDNMCECCSNACIVLYGWARGYNCVEQIGSYPDRKHKCAGCATTSVCCTSESVCDDEDYDPPPCCDRDPDTKGDMCCWGNCFDSDPNDDTVYNPNTRSYDGADDDKHCCGGWCESNVCSVKVNCYDPRGDGLAESCCPSDKPYAENKKEWNGTSCNNVPGANTAYSKQVCSECLSDDHCIGDEGDPSDDIYFKCCNEKGENKCYDAREKSCCAPLDDGNKATGYEGKLDHCPELESRECRILDDSNTMCCGSPCSRCDPINEWCKCEKAYPLVSQSDLWSKWGCGGTIGNFNVDYIYDPPLQSGSGWRRPTFDSCKYANVKTNDIAATYPGKFDIKVCSVPDSAEGVLGGGCSSSGLLSWIYEGKEITLDVGPYIGGFSGPNGGMGVGAMARLNWWSELPDTGWADWGFEGIIGVGPHFSGYRNQWEERWEEDVLHEEYNEETGRWRRWWTTEEFSLNHEDAGVMLADGTWAELWGPFNVDLLKLLNIPAPEWLEARWKGPAGLHYDFAETSEDADWRWEVTGKFGMDIRFKNVLRRYDTSDPFNPVLVELLRGLKLGVDLIPRSDPGNVLPSHLEYRIILSYPLPF